MKVDEFCGEIFTNLEVTAFLEMRGRTPMYLVRCTVCALDVELYGDGVFKASKQSIKSGSLPCGCSKTPHRTEQQYEVLCRRQAEKQGYLFNGWAGVYSKGDTKLRLLCGKHGEWDSTEIRHFLKSGCGCPSCGDDKCRLINTKSDDLITDKFFATGSFVDGTTFSRSQRLNSQGKRCFWSVYCPACETTSECSHSNLQRGTLPCDCGRSRQRQAYINLIKDGETSLAVKFGISYNSLHRMGYQVRKSAYSVEQLFVYEFNKVEDCYQAERELKQSLTCGILSKYDFPDGYTETTYIHNIDAILKTFERFGGSYITRPDITPNG